MDEPHPGKTTFMIMVSPLPDKYELKWPLHLLPPSVPCPPRHGEPPAAPPTQLISPQKVNRDSSFLLYFSPKHGGALLASGGTGAVQPCSEREVQPGGVTMPWGAGHRRGQEVQGPVQLILTWQGRYHDHESGFPRVRLLSLIHI